MWVVLSVLMLYLSTVQSRLKTFTLNCNDKLPLMLDDYTKVIAEHCHLTSLDVNIFGGDPRHRPSAVVYLLLTGNQLTELSNFAFARCGQMKTIDVSNNEISAVMPKAFHGLGDLKTLDMSRNKITHLAATLLSNLTGLENFLMRGNLLVAVDLNLFAKKPKMKIVDLGQNRIQNFVCSESDCDDIHVMYVKLDQNDLIDISKLHLVKSLTQLILSDNRNLQFSGFNMNNFPYLTDLSLASTDLQKLGDNLQFLPTLNSLKTLNLMDNGLETFPAEHLPVLHHVRDLNLANNQINYLDTDLLLQKFPSLQHIELSDNNWDCVDLRKWIKLMKRRHIEVIFNVSSRIQGRQNNVHGVGCLHKSEENARKIERLADELKEMQQNKGLIIVGLVVLNIFQVLVICSRCCVKKKRMRRQGSSEKIADALDMKFYVRNGYEASFDQLPPPPAPTDG